MPQTRPSHYPAMAPKKTLYLTPSPYGGINWPRFATSKPLPSGRTRMNQGPGLRGCQGALPRQAQFGRRPGPSTFLAEPSPWNRQQSPPTARYLPRIAVSARPEMRIDDDSGSSGAHGRVKARRLYLSEDGPSGHGAAGELGRETSNSKQAARRTQSN